MKHKILLITDCKPGHENISLGIAEEIQKEYNIDIVKLSVRFRYKFLRYILRFLLNKGWCKKLFKYKEVFYKIDNVDFADRNDTYKLIISTGGDTSYLNAITRCYLNIPNIYCSSLRGLDHALFQYLVTLDPIGYDNEIAVDLAPLSISISQDQVKQFKQKLHIEKNDEVWTLLIGGPTVDYPFGEDELVRMVKYFIELLRKNGVKGCITTSRRTPKSVEEKLDSIIHKHTDLLKMVVLYRKNPQKVLKLMLSVSNKVFCTEESGSMITEAILSKKKEVYTIHSKSDPKGIYKVFIERLEKKGYIRRIAIEEMNLLDFTDTTQNKIIDYSPARIVLDHIRKDLERQP